MKPENNTENTAGSDGQERLVLHLLDEAKRAAGINDFDPERKTATEVKAAYDMEEHKIKSRALLDTALKSERLVRILQLLAERLVWVAPVGNDHSYQKRDENGAWRPLPALRGFMVCKRAVNNVDGKNTRVDFLRVDASLPWRWKKPFRECESMFETMEAAIMAAVDVEGIALQNAGGLARGLAAPTSPKTI
jgi:hypothetical protein